MMRIKARAISTLWLVWLLSGEAPAEDRRLEGRVRDESGAHLPRASIQARDEHGTIVAAAQTNSRGEFVLELPEGRYQVSASLAGFASGEGITLAVGASTPPIELTLRIPGVEHQIVVTATRTEAPLPQVGSSVTVWTGEQLSRDGIATVADALRRVAGLTVVQSGPAGQLASLFVRGGESDYTKVLIDGITVNDPGGSFNFANMSTTGVERIEVIRGPQSALFGSDAIAGVIQIFTRRGTSEGLSPKPTAAVEGGTFGTLRYGGGMEGRNERANYYAGFSRLDTDNNVDNGSFNQTTFTGSLGVTVSRTAELRAVFRAENGRTGVPGAWAFRRPEEDEHFRRRDLAGGLTFTHHATRSWTQALSYTVNDSRQLSIDPGDSGTFVSQFEGRQAPFTSLDFPFRFQNQVRREKIQYQTDVILQGGHLLTAGADYERESGAIGDPGFEILEAARDNFGFYFQDQWSFRNHLFASAGFRLEHNESFGVYVTPRASLALHLHQPSPGSVWGLTKLKGNYGLGIKEPTLVESFSSSPFFRGNPDLLPEKSISFDAGVEQHFRQGRGMIEIVYFDNRFRDQIGFETTDFTTFEGSFFNIGKARGRGLESIVRSELPAGLELSGAYTFLSSKVLENSGGFDPAFAEGQELFRRPRHSGFVDLRWKPGSWLFGVTGLFVGRRVDSDFSGLGLTRSPGYGVLNLLWSYRLTGGSSLFAVVHNALDRSYMEVLGYPALRRSFRIGVRLGM